jgi:glycine betaine/proline transport system substrate-binding protein
VVGKLTIRWIIPIAVMMFMLVIAACADDNGDDDAAVETDDVEEVDDSDADDSDAAATGEHTWDGPIVFADYDWDSAQALNHIIRVILEEGYDYETDAVFGQTIPLFQGLMTDDIQISMEIWVDQQEGWEPALEQGQLHDLGPSFGESVQGWFVPRYVVEGDEERDIEPMAPDLRHVDDLPDYWEVFQDPEDSSKGRFYDCIAGWECERVNEAKFYSYGLDDTYNRFLPGSGAALDTSLLTAYDRGQAWLGYYWGPSWVFGQLDLLMLEEPEYTEECWSGIQDALAADEIPEEACAYPAVPVHIAVTDEFYNEAPDVVELLENVDLVMEDVSEILAYMLEEDVDVEDGAIWFLREREDLWTNWVSEDVADRVREAIS